MTASLPDPAPSSVHDTPLLVALRRGALLSSDEEMLLRSPDVRALGPREQLEFLNSNRRVGRAVTIFAGGSRLTLIAGALLSHLGLVASGSLAFALWCPALWSLLVGLLVWLAPAFRRRVNALSRRLPTFDELGRPGEP